MDRTAAPLPPIERNEHMDRDYIPLPGGWEVQTKGKGSSFRLCNTKTGERDLVIDAHLHETLVQMAHDIRNGFTEAILAQREQDAAIAHRKILGSGHDNGLAKKVAAAIRGKAP